MEFVAPTFKRPENQKKKYVTLLLFLNLACIAIALAFSFFYEHWELFRVEALIAGILLLAVISIHKGYFELTGLVAGASVYGLTAYVPLLCGELSGTFLSIIAIFLTVSYILERRVFQLLNGLFAILGFIACVWVTSLPGVEALDSPFYLDVFSLTMTFFIIVMTWYLAQRDLRTQGEKLNQTNTFLRLLADLNPQLILVKDQKQRFTFINETALEIYDLKEEDVLGKTEKELIPDFVEENPESTQKELRVLEHGETVETGPEFHPQTAFGPMWFNAIKKPMLDTDGETRGILILATNITERMKVEEALVESESRYKSNVENNQFGMVSDINGKLSSVNRAFCQMTGFDQEELIGKNIFDLLQLENPDDVQKRLKKLIQEEVPYVEFSCTFTRKNGSMGYGLVRKSVIKNAQGEVVEHLSTIADVSNLKEAENQLRYSQQRYQTLFQSMPLGLVVLKLRKELIPIETNNKWEEMIGIAAQDSSIHGLLECSPKFQPDGTSSKFRLKSIAKHYQNKFEAQTFEWYFKNKQEKVFPTICILQPIGEKEQMLSLMIVKDISEEKKQAATISRQLTDLNEKNEQLSQFGYIVSHNFRASVANIMGLYEILKSYDSTNGEIGQYLQMMGKVVHKLDEAIKDLNWIFSIQRNSEEEFEEVDLGLLVEKIKEEYIDEARSEGGEINISKDSYTGVRGIKSYYHSILQNLFSNSLKYAQEGRPLSIDIDLQTKGGDLLLEFSDNGRGIDMERYGDQVFNLYRRFHDDREGKGMGLYLVKAQTELMNGKVSLRSEVGKGTTFRFVFPLATSTLSETKKTALQ